MSEDPNKVMYFAETDSRNRSIRFGIKTKDRSRHMYVIGKTGMGKSTLLENLAIQDIQDGHGLTFIDPHGKTAELLLDYVPEHRLKDVIYFAPFDLDNPISFNVLEEVGPDKRHLVANGLMSAFKRIWADAWSARMQYILNNILLALLESPGSTLLGVNRMLADENYRAKVVANVSDPSVKSFWNDEFAKYGPKYMQEAGAAIQNKIGQFISNPLVRNIIGQPESAFDIRKVMDEKKILIINLSKGKVGEANANLLGSMLITKIYLSAMSRADVHEEELQLLPNFYLYVDEFQNFANESFADILSEARKYKLNLIVAHQYIEQMTEEVRAAVFGNVGTMIVFRVGAFDAEFLEKEFAPNFTAEDLVNLGFTQIYLKLMIDGVTSKPFSSNTLAPIPKASTHYRKEIIENSRKTHSRSRAEVEEEIMKWHEEMQADVNAKFQEKKDMKRRTTIDSALEAVLGRPPMPRSALSTVPSAAPSATQSSQSHTSQNHSQPSASSTPYNSPPSSNQPAAKSQKEIEALRREKDLRKAVSLSYLKQTNKIEKEKKIPTQEHLEDLRKALVEIAGDVVIEKKAQEENVTPKVETSHISHPKPEEKRENISNAGRQDSSPVNNLGPKELPEDVLRRVLKID